jgi:hypothetical protein
LSINYLFFALQTGTWTDTYAPLWRAFWKHYTEGREDTALLQHAPPYFAWRALVLANPVWYPDIDAKVRDALLGLAETALDAERFTLHHAEALFS